MKIDLEDLKKVTLSPTDVLVFTVPVPLTPDQFALINEKLTKFFPNNKILVLDKNTELQVVAEHKGCEARQYSDQMTCVRCSLNWDMNDPNPPRCGKE